MVLTGIIYVVIFLVFLLIISFTNGYIGKFFDIKDFLAALFWPMTIFELLGILTKIIIEKKGKKGKKRKNSK